MPVLTARSSLRPLQGTVRSGVLTRVLDLHGGRMLLWLIGSLKKQRNPVDPPATIGICAFGAIGDALLSSGIAADLRQHYPAARIVMILSQSNRGLSCMLADCGEFMVLPMYSPKRAVKMMRREKFDLLIDANQWLRISALYCALAGAKCTVGFRTAGQFRHYAFDRVAEHERSRHEMDNFRALLAAVGLMGGATPRLTISPKDQVTVRGMVTPPYVVFHPWAGGGRAALKEWPKENWIAVARELIAQGYTIVVSGAPADGLNTNILLGAAERAGVSITRMAGKLTLGQTACLLQTAALVISVNTGVMHMAAALGSPLVALHGPTNPKRWGPLSENCVSLVPTDVPSGVATCYLNLGFEFPFDATVCMSFISVETVLAAAAAVLEKDQKAKLRPQAPDHTNESPVERATAPEQVYSEVVGK
jgi:ADP-heptose:LPS heptosyltransferase